MSILPLHFEPKIGSKEPENRQNLKFERDLLSQGSQYPRNMDPLAIVENRCFEPSQ